MVAERAPLINNTLDRVNKRPLLEALPSIEQNPLERPLAPLSSMEPAPPPPEPAPWTATAPEWQDWVSKRDTYEDYKDAKEKAINYANENDLRGVPFS